MSATQELITKITGHQALAQQALARRRDMVDEGVPDRAVDFGVDILEMPATPRRALIGTYTSNTDTNEGAHPSLADFVPAPTIPARRSAGMLGHEMFQGLQIAPEATNRERDLSADLVAQPRRATITHTGGYEYSDADEEESDANQGEGTGFIDLDQVLISETSTPAGHENDARAEDRNRAGSWLGGKLRSGVFERLGIRDTPDEQGPYDALIGFFDNQSQPRGKREGKVPFKLFF